MRKIACLAAFALALAAAPGLATEIGSVAAVNTDVTGTPPAANSRILNISDEVVLNERIVSSATGTAQFLFLDQTSLTVSPQSDLVLDRYVYDPDQGTGDIAVGMTKGVLRFIGGRISKSSDAVVRTPITTIGIRGGISLVVASDGIVRIVHAAGDYTRAGCDAGTSCKGPPVTVSRPNAVIEVRPGEAPQYAGIISPAGIAEIYEALSVTSGGGARNIDQIVAVLGRGQEGTAAVPSGGNAPYQNPISTRGESSVAVAPLDLSQDSMTSDTEFRTLAFSDPRFLDSIGGDGGFVDVGGSGQVRGQLVWNNNSDLDLHLFLPNDAGEVAFFNQTIVFNNGQATATLDFDNLGGTINQPPDLRVENIVVNGQVPGGTYNFLVDLFSGRSNPTTPFTLTMTPDGGQTTQTVTGILESGDSGLIPLIVPGAPGIPETTPPTSVSQAGS